MHSETGSKQNYKGLIIFEFNSQAICMQLRLFICLFLYAPFCSMAQTKWKLSKDKDGIHVYTGTSENTKYKSIRVKCEFAGSISRLRTILRDVPHHSDWVYKAKNVSLVKQPTPDEIIYYMETEVPWPVSNRDGVYHITMQADSLHHSFSAVVVSDAGYVPEKSGKVRVSSSKAVWTVTEAGGKIKIDYTLEVDPAGSVPAWVVNMFVDKGPYETFRNLEKMLRAGA